MPVGIYISVPFCRTKCSFCNFASNVFSKSAYENYLLRLLQDVAGAREWASQMGCVLEDVADSIYLGGGTPSILEPSQLRRVFEGVTEQFTLARNCEITVECAPGTISPALIETLLQCEVNRVSLGVQSFVDQEAKSVGRLHTRTIVLDDIRRLRAVGISNISIDLIAGLPYQTAESWEFSVAETIATEVPHVSVYMLEVDEDSRLGGELLAGGARYHAHYVPDDDASAAFYEQGCEMLEDADITQYEISNFARAGATGKNFQSLHNLKYWTRQPYMGFGVDAHSMLLTAEGRAAISGESEPCRAVRFATPDSLDAYMNHAANTVTPVTAEAAMEEEFFLGLRLNRGIEVERLRKGTTAAEAHIDSAIRENVEDGLLEKHQKRLRLTARGRLLSNEVFARFLAKEKSKVGTDYVNPR
jgi:putative oxygen-independent coproporphyrinogen III oxidase